MQTLLIMLRSSNWFHDYKAALIVVFLVIGLVQCFYGYKFFKLIMAIMGFIIGLPIGFAIGGLLGRDPVVAIVSAIVGGLVFSELAILFYYLSIFIVGAITGALGFFLLAQLFQMHPDVAVFILFGLIGGIIALYFQKFVIILGTSLGGAYYVISSLFLAMMDSRKFSALFNLDEGAISYYNLSGTVTLFFFLVVFTTIVGILFQYGKLENFSEKLNSGDLWNQIRLTKDDVQGDAGDLKNKFGRNK